MTHDTDDHHPGHVHGHGHHHHDDHDHADHEHDHAHAHGDDEHYIGPDFEGPIEEHPLWQRDNVTLTSVGIDIGSAGTQILFSRLHLRRQSVDLSSRFLVVGRETWYESPVSLTPYESETLIDARALGEIVDHAYNTARVHPDEIDTGVVILTGEALRRDNSERIGQILAEKCGELVCVTAGHHMEAMLAAHGSGAVQAAHDRDECVINVDIGGGTTKISIIDRGQVRATAALHIGGRLLAVDGYGVLERLDPAGHAHARQAGFDWRVGDTVTDAQLDQVAGSMADDLVEALVSAAPSHRVQSLYLTDPITDYRGIDSVVFSGGVSEFIYHREERDFGDLGRRLGHAIRARVDAATIPWNLIEDCQGIRATVLGASEYTTQLSGNTGFISSPGALLPRRNIQVVHTEFDFADVFDADRLATAIADNIRMFDLTGTDADIVLAFHWQGQPEFRRVEALAQGIREGVRERLERGKPLYVILDADIAMTLGNVLRHDMALPNEILIIDGVALWNFDYIDLGRIRMPSNTVPVMIKSLVFKDVSGGGHRYERIHFQEDTTSEH